MPKITLNGFVDRAIMIIFANYKQSHLWKKASTYVLTGMKRLLRQKANFGILEGLLTTLLGMNIHIKNTLESESNQDDEDDKYNRVDTPPRTTKGSFSL